MYRVKNSCNQILRWLLSISGSTKHLKIIRSIAMSLYLQIPHVKGNVTTQGYQNWIQLSSMNFTASRPVSQEVGRVRNRNLNHPNIQKIELSKPIDNASNALLENLLKGSSLGTLHIHVCSTDKQLTPYLKYELSDAMVTHYQEMTGEEGFPHEQLTLSFTKLQRTNIPRNAAGQSQSPQTMGYTLETAQLS